MSRFLGWTVSLAFALVLAGGCGDDEECGKGKIECVSDTLVRACVPGDEGNRWFTYECGTGERCGTSTAPAPDPAGMPAAGGVPACVGATCMAGQSECVGTNLTRHCVDGREWQLQPCEAGQSCVDGACMFSDAGLEACTPGARACGSEEVEKVCDLDGSKWLEQDCDPSEKCLVDRCAPNPDASCDVPSRCLDNKTAARCRGETSGFEVIECEGDTYCEDGRCRGTVCALGSLCTMANQLVECVDGVTLRTVQCAVNEACKQTRDVAECVPKPCEPGQVECGDPRDPSVDATRFYSQCLPAASTESGLPEWVTGECTDLLTCDPVTAALGQPCQQECTPGAQTCMADLMLGIADGWAECQDDGTWGSVTSCNPGGGARRACVIKPSLDASALPEALCASPVCAYVIENQDNEGGSCAGAQVQRCDEDGQLADPEACPMGICRATAMAAEADGRVPGACDEMVDCEPGEQRCLIDDLLPTPLFQNCEAGIWSAQLRSCPDDGDCRDYIDPEGLRKRVCGAECAPGEKRCNISDQVESCDADGQWGNAESCDVGICSTIATTTGARDAGCVLECIPGERRCTGTVVPATDGVSTGLSQEATCDSDGLLGAPTTCATDTTCRMSGIGEHIGCVECLGPDVLGGNEWGYQDTRCAPTTPANVQSCGADNTWANSRVCAGGKVCRMVNGDTCGQCSVNALLMTCSETNVAMQQFCGPCTDPSFGTLAQCRNASIVSLTAATTMETCESLFGNGTATETLGQAVGTTSWGGALDCCDGMTSVGTDGEFLIGYTCAMRGYGTPVAAGGVADCCSLYVTPGVGPAFAYCAVP